VTALHLLLTGLSQLLAAVHADDPRRELLVRVGDLMRETKSLTAALDGMVVVRKEQVKAMSRFIMWSMNEGPWDGCDLYGGDVQDKAVELGLIVKCDHRPDWFVPAKWIIDILPATPQAQGE
jgi:hypothetical protein